MTPNRLKSRFILIYPPLVILIGVASLFGLAFSHARLAWAGALLTALPFVGLYLRATLSRSLARTSRSLPILSLVAVAGAALAAYASWRSGQSALAPLAAAASGAIGFFLYTLWYSSFGRGVNECLRKGNSLPDFRAFDSAGNAVGPSDLLGKPALFMFYRGNWCPFCMAQIREVTQRYRELADLGVEVVLISPQPTELTQRVAEMFEVPCRFWVDRGLSAAAELGIVHDEGVPPGSLRRKYGSDTVLPTVVIVDADGKILFADQTDNYRVRPDPDVFLRALQAHGYRAGHA